MADQSDIQEPDLRDADAVAELFRRAERANLETPGRAGSVVDLPQKGRLLMTGDLHDNAQNYQRLLKLAQLDAGPDNRLILHEVIHGPDLVNGMDLSVRMLARVAALKCRYPDQVYVLQSNHELAQLRKEGILKEGRDTVESFDEGLDFLYGGQADDVREAMNGYLRSLLLAVRCANGIFASHSIPSNSRARSFDPTVIDRIPTTEDLSEKGDVYYMVWGRNQNQATADALAEAWGCKQFVMGHQPADMGYEPQGETLLILASDHSHGVALPIDLARAYDQEQLIGAIIPLASVTL
jgi:calcineurin-like phosphoesterase family protein